MFSENVLNTLKFLDSQHNTDRRFQGNTQCPGLICLHPYLLNLGCRPSLGASLFGSPHALTDGKSSYCTKVAISESQWASPWLICRKCLLQKHIPPLCLRQDHTEPFEMIIIKISRKNSSSPFQIIEKICPLNSFSYLPSLLHAALWAHLLLFASQES